MIVLSASYFASIFPNRGYAFEETRAMAIIKIGIETRKIEARRRFITYAITVPDTSIKGARTLGRMSV